MYCATVGGPRYGSAGPQTPMTRAMPRRSGDGPADGARADGARADGARNDANRLPAPPDGTAR